MSDGEGRELSHHELVARVPPSSIFWHWLRRHGIRLLSSPGIGGRPPRGRTNRVQMIARIDPALLKRVKAHARATGRDLWVVVEDALRRELGQLPPRAPLISRRS